ncbi:DUF899 domain-containing protein [Paraburkholderia diazotrophica]|uniref:Predicted dithiol-disulfide oxidoreductase, DUF899 family n=1 Tax=Paraburkholderia diazotrophica TaxID=667676 RepID=A0A1H6QFD7_9BURK|nr:thioredoxin family protein [Paraburkholderia diazotrophica]SEI38190.1 Predicted dithiol-disulfide oxidoreductase, DUF899 family [Paraburkholderia diazotrophica]
MEQHKIVSREEWLAAQRAHLVEEKAFTRARDALAKKRQALPWVKVDKTYMFDTPDGKKTLADLFAGRSQLIVYHFMFGPDWEQGCPGCSFLSDHIDGALVHLAHRDVTYVAISRAPLEKIEAFKERMGWQFPWVSSFGSDFNYDFNVSFTPQQEAEGKVVYNFDTQDYACDELPGMSVFYRNDKGEIFRTFASFARGGEPLIGTYTLLDYVPKGRDEGENKMMGWLRRHDSYEDGVTGRSLTEGKEADACCHSATHK